MDSIRQFFERLFDLPEDIFVRVDNTTHKGISLEIEFDTHLTISIEQMRNIEDFFHATQIFYQTIWVFYGYDPDDGYYMSKFTVFTTDTEFYYEQSE